MERLYSLFGEKRATGVAYGLNLLLHPDGLKDTRSVRVTKLLVSARAFGPTGILECSGIGALKRIGLKQHVGEN